MIRTYLNLVVAVLIAVQMDVDGTPLVFGWHGLALALLVILFMAVIDVYSMIRDL